MVSRIFKVNVLLLGLAWRQDLPGKIGHGKGELIALGVTRKGRLIRARGWEWCCQFGEDAPALPQA